MPKRKWEDFEIEKMREIASTSGNRSAAIDSYQQWTEGQGIPRSRNAIYLRIRIVESRLNLQGISCY